jgi:hypothetical protein
MSDPMIDGRRADSDRRRGRVIEALRLASVSGTSVTVSGVARAARVDRTFLYRHTDLLARIHLAQSALPPPSANPAAVTRESLAADLANAQHRIGALAARNALLERKLSEMLGQRAWRESGLGSPVDIERLQLRITALEQQAVDLTGLLDERDQELDAARHANRELFSNINRD